MKIQEEQLQGLSLDDLLQSCQRYFSQIQSISSKKISIFLTSLIITKENILKYYYKGEQKELDTEKKDFIMSIY